MRTLFPKLKNIAWFMSVMALVTSCDDKIDSPNPGDSLPMEITLAFPPNSSKVNSVFNDGDRALLVESSSDQIIDVINSHEMVLKEILNDEKVNARFVPEDPNFTSFDPSTKYVHLFYVSPDSIEGGLQEGETPLEGFVRTINKQHQDGNRDAKTGASLLENKYLFKTNMISLSSYGSQVEKLIWQPIPKMQFIISGSVDDVPPASVSLKCGDEGLALNDEINIELTNVEYKEEATQIRVFANTITPMLTTHYKINLTASNDFAQEIDTTFTEKRTWMEIKYKNPQVEPDPEPEPEPEPADPTELTDDVINGIDIAAYSLTGSGTLSDPYLLKNAKDFAYFVKYVNEFSATEGSSSIFSGGTQSADKFKYIKLESDIKVSTASWTPINQSGNKNLQGFSFDGNGKTISGELKLSNTESEYFGLFGKLQYGVIRNLNITANITTSACSELQYCGSLIGHCQNGLDITDCKYNGTITSDAASLGGLAGYYGGGTISGCKLTGEIRGTFDKIKSSKSIPSCIGGICAESLKTQGAQNAYIENCTLEDMIIVSESGNTVNIGGAVAFNKGEYTISNVAYKGSINAGTQDVENTLEICVGGIIGQNQKITEEGNASNILSNGTCTGCSFDGTIIGRDLQANNNSSINTGGLIGKNIKMEFHKCTCSGTITGATATLGKPVNNGLLAGKASLNSPNDMFYDCNNYSGMKLDDGTVGDDAKVWAAPVKKEFVTCREHTNE